MKGVWNIKYNKNGETFLECLVCGTKEEAEKIAASYNTPHWVDNGALTNKVFRN